MLYTIIAGLGAGATYSLTMFAKKQGQPFDVEKFIATILIGGIAGIGMVLYGIPVEANYAYLINVGLVPLIENLIKMVLRKGSNLKSLLVV